MRRVFSSLWLAACFACASLLATQALAKEAVPMAQEPEVEARLVKIAEELRCMVCQNESLASSHAELAEDLRREVRDLIKSGKNDAQVKEFCEKLLVNPVIENFEIRELV
jgi:cytochrome c-type biogenesis protein CcmH